MKLYDYKGAPNPRRVKIFLAEKGVEVEIIHCDMAKGEHKTPGFLAKNASGKIPVLELDDGRCLGESVAICRYLEAIHPEPNLFGRDPFELGHVEMRNRQIELELWTQIGIAWVNGPIVGKMGRFTQNQQAKETSENNVRRYYKRLDGELSDSDSLSGNSLSGNSLSGNSVSGKYVAGDRFTVADITLLTAIDFAGSLVELKPDVELGHLWRWHQMVSERASVD